ncbi:MAG: YajG family lipoprotein [Vibrionaceae bacterium]
MKAIFLISGVLFFLSGCSLNPKSLLTIDPKPLLVSNKETVISAPLQIKAIDQRKTIVIAQMKKGKDKNILLGTATNLRLMVKDKLTEQLTAQGFSFTQGQSGSSVQIALIQAYTTGEQNIFSYKLNSNVVLEITAKKGQKTFVKRYSGNANKTHIFQASAADIQTELTKLLEVVLHDIAMDQRLFTFLNSRV